MTVLGLFGKNRQWLLDNSKSIKYVLDTLIQQTTHGPVISHGLSHWHDSHFKTLLALTLQSQKLPTSRISSCFKAKSTVPMKCLTPHCCNLSWEQITYLKAWIEEWAYENLGQCLLLKDSNDITRDSQKKKKKLYHTSP